MIQVYDTKQTAKLLGISFSSIRAIMREGGITYHRIGKTSIRFTEENIKEYLEKNAVRGTSRATAENSAMASESVGMNTESKSLGKLL